MNTGFPLLSVCLGWPLLGAFALAFIRDTHKAKRVALVVALLELLLTGVIVAAFDSDSGALQMQEQYAWIPSLNVHYHLGLDGIAALLLPMSALLTVTGFLASWNSVQHLTRFHLALLLVLQSVTVGVLTALDMVLFFLFWELTLPPLFFLMGLWGIGAHRRHAALQYTLFMLFGGVPLLFAMIVLATQYALQHGGALLFDLPLLLQQPLSADWQPWVFGLLVLGFAVKAPLLPFHTWLPKTALEAPTHITALLTGLKLGVFGLLRFALPLAPQAAWEHRWLLAIVGVVTLIYAALIALQQTNLRRLLAYASISHVGLVVTGLATLNEQGVQGAVLQLFNFSLIASSLMLLAGFIQQRLGSNEQVHLGGLAKVMPRLSVLFFLFAFASIGVPGTVGFPAELLLLLGTLDAFPVLALVVLLAGVVGTAYLLDAMRQTFWGVLPDSASMAQDLRPRELALLAVPALLVLALGFYPNGVLQVSKATVGVWLERLYLQRQGVRI